MVDTLRAIVSDMRSLAPFPHVATTVLSLASKPDVVPQQLIAVIQTDPGLTGKVLKLCNSAYYGFQREIASLEEAGNMVGVRTLTNLVLTSCGSKYFKEAAGGSTEATEEAWGEAVRTAVASRLVARTVGRTDPERAYTSGLLLNVGGLVLARFCEADRARVEAEVEAGRPRILAEKVVLGMSHAEIGARLVTRWMLPEVLVDTIRHHHSPEKADRDPSLAATVHLGEALARTIHGTSVDQQEEPLTLDDRYEVSQVAWRVTDLLPHDLLGMEPQLRQELRSAEEALAA